MASDPKCKLCRRAGEKLFLKAEKCFTHKCIFEKRPTTPGMADHQRKHRSSVSEYGTQLREKQKVKNTYGVGEKQFVNYIKEASSGQGINPSEKLFEVLESRLDNAVFRMGLSDSHSGARQMVSHGHIMINGRRVNIPSYQFKIGDILSIREGSKGKALFFNISEKLKKHSSPKWLAFDATKLEGKFLAKPKLDKVYMPYNLTSIIEFYSR